MSSDTESTRTVSRDKVYWTLVVLAAALIANPLVLDALIPENPPPDRVAISDPGYQRIKEVEVLQADDAGKPGLMRSMMEWVEFSQQGRTSGRSPDELRLLFNSAAMIHGVHVSVDVNPAFDLVEIAVGVNNDPGYSQIRSADYLLHASYTGLPGVPGSIDETIWIPGGLEVAAGDYVGVGGWVGTVTADEAAVYPELIIFYEWIDG